MNNHLSQNSLLSSIDQAADLVSVGAFYSHYRDPQSRYQVIGLCIIEASQEPGVLYRKANGDPLHSVVWMRPLDSWMGQVELENGDAVPRFQKVT